MRDNEWKAYYDHFSYFSAENVRDGCHPRIMEHRNTPRKAVVLVHGLSDSPYFMTAIAEYFFNYLGYNVYLPLLHGHGLKEPNGMEAVDLDEWKANAAYAIGAAASKADEVSVGGLSTGGTLGFYMATVNPDVNGSLYLFSAALDLAGGPYGLIGEIRENLLQTFFADFLDTNQPLVGENPYRYTHVDIDGAAELARLIGETDSLIGGFSRRFPYSRKVFAAHSACDTTSDIAGIEALKAVSLQDRFTLFRIPEYLGVRHASVVLKDPIMNGGKLLEAANPVFGDMMEAIAAFEKRQDGI
ncbi:MAG: alpha/beta hydrolase [Chlorobi bacterium]|nr:alpha/beta hydrolase [Chlorobiota bacterium]